MINIVGKRKIFFSISSLLVGLSILFVVLFGLKPGIDFTGGALMEISFTGERPVMSDIQAEFADNTYGNVRVQPTESNGYILKMRFISEEEHSKSKILVSPRVYTLRFFLFAKAHKKKRKGFESNFSRRNFTNSQRASCKLRKTLVFIRFDEEGTIF